MPRRTSQRAVRPAKISPMTLGPPALPTHTIDPAKVMRPKLVRQARYALSNAAFAANVQSSQQETEEYVIPHYALPAPLQQEMHKDLNEAMDYTLQRTNLHIQALSPYYHPIVAHYQPLPTPLSDKSDAEAGYITPPTPGQIIQRHDVEVIPLHCNNRGQDAPETLFCWMCKVMEGHGDQQTEANGTTADPVIPCLEPFYPRPHSVSPKCTSLMMRRHDDVVQSCQHGAAALRYWCRQLNKYWYDVCQDLDCPVCSSVLRDIMDREDAEHNPFLDDTSTGSHRSHSPLLERPDFASRLVLAHTGGATDLGWFSVPTPRTSPESDTVRGASNTFVWESTSIWQSDQQKDGDTIMVSSLSSSALLGTRLKAQRSRTGEVVPVKLKFLPMGSRKQVGNGKRRRSQSPAGLPFNIGPLPIAPSLPAPRKGAPRKRIVNKADKSAKP